MEQPALRLPPPPRIGRRSSIPEETAARLRSAIVSGRWPPGHRLPPERELAAELGVSRLSLRGALASLAREGLVRSRQGSGAEVLDLRRNAHLDLFSYLLDSAALGGARTAELFAEMVRIRRVLAVDTLVRAAEVASEADIAGLEEIAEAQARLLDQPLAYFAGDAEFSRGVIRISGSMALELLFNSLQQVLDAHPELALVFLGPLEEHLGTYEVVLRLMRHPRPQEFRRLAESALDLVESRGLERVREYCARREGGRS